MRRTKRKTPWSCKMFRSVFFFLPCDIHSFQAFPNKPSNDLLMSCTRQQTPYFASSIDDAHMHALAESYYCCAYVCVCVVEMGEGTSRGADTPYTPAIYAMMTLLLPFDRRSHAIFGIQAKERKTDRERERERERERRTMT